MKAGAQAVGQSGCRGTGADHAEAMQGEQEH